MKYLLTLLACLSMMISCQIKNKNTKQDSSAKTLFFEVVRRYPHNENNFTQGLELHAKDNLMLESTGQHRTSRIVSYALSSESKKDEKSFNEKEHIKLSGEYFGEGISLLGEQLVQLTWKNNVMFVYQYPSFNLKKKVNISYEGWGITHDESHFIVSDGTSKIRWLDAENFKEQKTINVHDEFGTLDYINELELVDGFLFANRWQTNKIIKIDTASGKVVGEIDVSFLSLEARDKYPDSDVANGIAYAPETQSFFLTGKYWPYIYEVKLIEK